MENLDEKIEQYLQGELTEAETTAFRQALENDPALAQSVAEHREIMERLEALRLRKKVKKALAQPTDRISTTPLFLSNRTFWILLASLLLLAFVLWQFGGKQSAVTPGVPSDTNQEQSAPAPGMAENTGSAPTKAPVKSSESRNRLLALARGYHERPTADVIRDAGESTQEKTAKTRIQLATDAFEKGNFSLAADILRPDELVAQDEVARFLRASARFEVGQYAGAAQDFNTLQSSLMYKQEARWNFLLCQLAMGKAETAKPLLSAMVSDPDFPFFAKAVELKSSLNF